MWEAAVSRRARTALHRGDAVTCDHVSVPARGACAPPSETRGDDRPPRLEPALDEDIFEHIIDVIRMHGQQLEQSPGTYAGMGEEDRRQTIVAVLNTHYSGRAYAEAFNNQARPASSSATRDATCLSASASSGQARKDSPTPLTSSSGTSAGTTRS